jgi:cytochrome c oxidase assembly protein subunit 15
MPFDLRPLTLPEAERPARQDARAVAAWLFGVAGLVWAMVAIGGATRLTGSGLSIMEWAPLSGALPPLSEAEWRRLYDLYRTIPQYALLNAGLRAGRVQGDLLAGVDPPPMGAADRAGLSRRA